MATSTFAVEHFSNLGTGVIKIQVDYRAIDHPDSFCEAMGEALGKFSEWMGLDEKYANLAKTVNAAICILDNSLPFGPDARLDKIPANSHDLFIGCACEVEGMPGQWEISRISGPATLKNKDGLVLIVPKMNFGRVKLLIGKGIEQ